MKEGKIKAGDIVVISSAAGAVGTIACQLAKLKGAYVIGLTSQERKAKFLKEELDVDYPLLYNDPLFPQRLRDAVHKLGGEIDCYIDSVGGQITEEVIPLMDNNSKIVLGN